MDTQKIKEKSWYWGVRAAMVLVPAVLGYLKSHDETHIKAQENKNVADVSYETLAKSVTELTTKIDEEHVALDKRLRALEVPKAEKVTTATETPRTRRVVRVSGIGAVGYGSGSGPAHATVMPAPPPEPLRKVVEELPKNLDEVMAKQAQQQAK